MDYPRKVARSAIDKKHVVNQLVVSIICKTIVTPLLPLFAKNLSSIEIPWIAPQMPNDGNYYDMFCLSGKSIKTYDSMYHCYLLSS